MNKAWEQNCPKLNVATNIQFLHPKENFVDSVGTDNVYDGTLDS